MYIATFRDPIREVHTSDDLRAALRFRHDAHFGTFWLWHTKGVCLAIMINDDEANMLFIPSEGHPGWQTLGIGSDEEVLFLADNYEATPMAREYAIPTTSAERAAVEFLATGVRPTCVEWFEL